MSDGSIANHISLEDYRWLVSRQAEPWLQRTFESCKDTPALVKSFRRDLSAVRVHLVLEQAELRRRGREKFADAQRMFFTRIGLEQATDQFVACYKAARYEEDIACVDLCCGMGGDLIALAKRTSKGGPSEMPGGVVGVDRDRIAALLAAANVDVCGGSAQVVVADASDFRLPAACAWHLDPDRRPDGRRTTHMQWHSPNLAAVERLIEDSPHGAIKLAPAADVPGVWLERVELEWISRRHQCRQLVVWLGSLARQPGLRRATLLLAKKSNQDKHPIGHTVHTIVGHPNLTIPVADRVGDYVFEPDPAVLAAHLSGELAIRHELKRLAEGSAYLTSDHANGDPLLGCFKVDEVMAFDRKRLKRFLAKRGIKRLEIKQRGMSLDPERLRRELQVGGGRTGKEGDAVLIVTKGGSGSLAVLGVRL